MEILNRPPLRTGGAAWCSIQERAPPVRASLYRGFWWQRVLRLLAFWLIAALLAGGAWGGEFDEYAVKAAYLYNFAKYVEWPSAVFTRPDAPMAICIVGENPFGAALSALAGKAVQLMGDG